MMNHDGSSPYGFNKNYENTLIEHTSINITIFKASFSLQKLPRPSFNAPKTIAKVSIGYPYFYVVENNPNSSSYCFARLHPK